MSRPLVVLFKRLGPYHHARLKAASAMGPVAVIELHPGDTTYEWDDVDAEGPYERHRLASPLEGKNAFEGLSRKLDALSPAAVAICGYAEPLAVWSLAWCVRNRVPAILMSDSAREDAPRIWFIEMIKSFIVKRFAAAFVAGTRHHAYVTELGLPDSSVVQGYDVVDNAFFACRCAELRAQPPHDVFPLASRKYILACCRFIPKKNVFTLIEAFRRFKASDEAEGWSLVLLGDGPLRPQIEARVEEYGLRSDVELPGFVQYEHLPRFYAFAQFFVHASVIDQWGLVVNEAMASSLPVLVSRQSGCSPDLVDHGRNGYLFDANDAGELAERIQGLAARDPEQIRLMGLRGSEIIGAFSCESFARNLWLAQELARKAPAASAPGVSSATLGMLAHAFHARTD